MTNQVEQCLFVNHTVKKGMNDLEFWDTMSSISRRGVWVDYFTKVC